MADSPFDGVGNGNVSEEQSVQAPAGSNKAVFVIVGLVLIVAGFVWKFVIGDVESADTAGLADFAWLAPVVIGGVLAAVAMRKPKNR